MLTDPLEIRCGCVLGGAGPAGMGLLFNALKNGTLPALAREGLIIVDSSPTPGAGCLGEYRITANSVGDVFLDCLRDPALREIFEPLEGTLAYWRIRHQAQSAPPLPDVGELLAEASTLVLEHIVRHFNVKLWHSTTITQVVGGNDEYEVWVESEGHVHCIRTRTLILNLGGRQDPQQLLDSLADQGLSVPPAATILGADRLLRMNSVELREQFAEALASDKSITLVGGSHSAFSMLENLADALEFAGLKQLNLVHRSPVRLFYESVEEARRAGYAFDPQEDVCPVSGRVNRSGGLRYRALDVGRAALAHGRVGNTGVKVRLLQTEGVSPEAKALAQQALTESAMVVQCTGYQPRLPALNRVDGSAISLRETTGGLDSDPGGCPLDETGQRLHGLHLFGLGAGLGVDPQLGSEPSFDGRIYGVWQFHHHASGAVIDAVLTRLRHKPRETSVSVPNLVERLENGLPFLFPGFAGIKT